MGDETTNSESTETRYMRRAISPSRASDFTSCPLKFRYRVIDRLPEPPDATSTRGTLVHAVLERLFDERAQDRDIAKAIELLPGEWGQMLTENPALASMFVDKAEEMLWLDSAKIFLESYFSLEDPQRLEPAKREWRVECPLDSGLTLVGILDRLDEAADGRIRIVDYKTGKSPSERFQDQAMTQMKFYALVVWKQTGVIPTVLQLMYLGDRNILSYSPTEVELKLTEKRFDAIWSAIEQAISQRNFPPKPGGLCRFCAHQEFCPEYGGEILPMPKVVLS